MNRIIVAAYILLSALLPSCGKATEPQVDSKNPSKPPQSINSSNSFVVVLKNGKSFRITPDVAKLQKEIKFFRNDNASTCYDRFQNIATFRIQKKDKEIPNCEIDKVVFYRLTGRNGSGDSFSTPFIIGNYASIEELK